MIVITVEEMKKQVSTLNEYLSTANKNCSWAKKAKKQKEALEFAIWKAETPEAFENHKKAWEDFKKAGFYTSVMKDN